jgi:hypothetical protein
MQNLGTEQRMLLETNFWQVQLILEAHAPLMKTKRFVCALSHLTTCWNLRPEPSSNSACSQANHSHHFSKPAREAGTKIKWHNVAHPKRI